MNLTFQALHAISNKLAAFPGRKNLVWVSSGIPANLRTSTFEEAEFRMYEQQMSRTIETLGNSNVAIYPVDARGLMGKSQINQLERVRAIARGWGFRPIADARLEAVGRNHISQVPKLSDQHALVRRPNRRPGIHRFQ